jgi:Flavoprotein
MTERRRVAYVGFSAPPVLQLAKCLELLRERGWDSYVTLSPTAATWVDVDHLAKVSGHRVRVAPRTPSEPDPLPDADAVLASPLTFNSLCKWAAGISDTLALGILNESLGLDPREHVGRDPTALRFSTGSQSCHQQSVKRLSTSVSKAIRRRSGSDAPSCSRSSPRHAER